MKGIDRPSYEALEGQLIENALMPDYNLELMYHYQTTAMSDEKQALVIMDVRAGLAVARERGLQMTGTASIIGIAKRRRLLSSAREAFKALHNNEFRISPGHYPRGAHFCW
jgi:hypothetical protein